ncbi:MAG: Trm112 family protein [Candidatus Hodarchaeaceae archaeon]|nr:Trm112 family protein [Candidatus Hodarchaeaceae archaeon]
MTKPAISRELLEILACPVCKRAVKLKGKELVCVGCGRRYPIVKNIPQMLPDELR